MPFRMRAEDFFVDEVTPSDFMPTNDFATSRTNYLRAARSLDKVVHGYTIPESDFEILSSKNPDLKSFIFVVKDYCERIGLNYNIFRKYYNVVHLGGKPEYESTAAFLATTAGLRKKEAYRIN